MSFRVMNFRILSVLTVLCCLALCATASSYERPKYVDKYTNFPFSSSLGLLDEAEGLVQSQAIILAGVRNDKNLDKYASLRELRILRSRITKHLPLIRNLVENINAYKISTSGQIAEIELYFKAAVNAETKQIDRSPIEIEKDAAKRSELLQLKKNVEDSNSILYDAQDRIRVIDAAFSQVDDETNQLIQNDTLRQQFTNYATYVFGLLVASVILGFFTIAFKSEKIREAIFSGESGIQFVTLFSLIIAIILFGVLGILEGKELSALLGGLSGYILGRGSNSNKVTSPTSGGNASPP